MGHALVANKKIKGDTLMNKGELIKVAAKTGINPKTKEAVEIPASKKPVMKFGKAYKDSFNN